MSLKVMQKIAAMTSAISQRSLHFTTLFLSLHFLTAFSFGRLKAKFDRTRTIWQDSKGSYFINHKEKAKFQLGA